MNCIDVLVKLNGKKNILDFFSDFWKMLAFTGSAFTQLYYYACRVHVVLKEALLSGPILFFIVKKQKSKLTKLLK